MGYFVNTLPLRLGGKFAGDEDFKSFLKNVRKVVLGAYNNMEIPFHKVMFSWEQSEDTSSTKYTELELPHQSAKFDLMLSMRYRRLNGVRSPAISMLSRSEREQLVSVWGMPRPPALLRPPSEFLDECLLAQVWKTPDHPALHFEGTQWTYQDLWVQLPRHQSLCMLDILVVPLSFISVCSWIEEWKMLRDRNIAVGAVFVPLDPEFPQIAAFVSSRESEEELAPRVLNYEDVDRLTSSSDGCARDDEFDSESRLLKRQKLDPDTATAYILYTSGSTGNPKGVVVPHAALMTTLWWTVRTYEVTSSDVFLQSTSTTLDGSLSQLFRLYSLAEAHESLVQRGSTICSTCESFRMPRELAMQNESSLFQGLHSVPIGKPIDEHPVVVLDAQRRLVPVNVPGELYIGGAGVARGYWRRPELTENSCQVKLHGMRVELQEVRNILLRSSSIKAAEVLSVPQLTSPGQKQQQMSSTLVAFVMPAESIDELSVRDGYLTELRAYLDQHLPLHMVPQSIQVVSSWPRTPNGRSIFERSQVGLAQTRQTLVLENKKKESTITVQLATDILRQVWMQALELQPVDGDQDMDDKLEANLMSSLSSNWVAIRWRLSERLLLRKHGDSP
ncbi:AMP-binding enzyme [Phytophthora infestans]|uniref:AMP-binding enzyme n=1 Tax=Phytophthora infestans TaxID=4787 RepID=A0A833TBV2_PHYIN|nr:AMP-binding enzyme [Phytophthora infestans]